MRSHASQIPAALCARHGLAPAAQRNRSFLSLTAFLPGLRALQRAFCDESRWQRRLQPCITSAARDAVRGQCPSPLAARVQLTLAGHVAKVSLLCARCRHLGISNLVLSGNLVFWAHDLHPAPTRAACAIWIMAIAFVHCLFRRLAVISD